MALTEEQRHARRGRIGASDARRIMAGEWLEVWQEKTGRRAEPDLSDNMLVQIGIATEPLHARLYAARTGIQVVPAAGKTFVHQSFGWACCHPDFLTWSESHFDYPEWDTLLEAKFNGGFQTLEEVAEYNYWQLAHQMWVTERQRAVLSLLQPRKDGYSFLVLERDEERIDQLVRTLQQFMWHIETDTQPGGQGPFQEPPTLERMRVLDMSANNHFCSMAHIILDNRAAVDASKAAESAIKADMPLDANIAYLPPGGGKAGLYLSKDKTGKISLRIGDIPPKHRKLSEVWMPASFTEAGE